MNYVELCKGRYVPVSELRRRFSSTAVAKILCKAHSVCTKDGERLIPLSELYRLRDESRCMRLCWVSVRSTVFRNGV